MLEQDVCEFIDSCPRASKIISKNMRQKYCYENASDCVGRAVIIQRGGIIGEGLQLYYAIKKFLFKEGFNPSYPCA